MPDCPVPQTTLEDQKAAVKHYRLPCASFPDAVILDAGDKELSIGEVDLRSKTLAIFSPNKDGFEGNFPKTGAFLLPYGGLRIPIVEGRVCRKGWILHYHLHLDPDKVVFPEW